MQRVNVNIFVYCLMNLINALEGTQAPFMWNGFIMGNSACNDVMICHSYDETTIGFREKIHWLFIFCDNIVCIGWTGRRQQGNRPHRPPRWQSEFLTCVCFSRAVCSRWSSLFNSFVFILTQGPPGVKGGRGEPGDPGYIVSEAHQTNTLFAPVLRHFVN